MADFDIEQLKTLFENLGDRLDKTKGDQLTNTELAKIRTIMSALGRQMDNKDPTKPVEPKKFIDEFWRQWRTEDPFKEVREQKSVGGQQPRGTIIKELQDAQNDIKAYNDELGGYSRTFGQRLDSFSNKLSDGTKKMDGFFSSIKSGGILGGMGALFGGAFDKINGYIDDKAEDYRTLMASEGSVGSIQQMNNAANSAAMSTRELALAMDQGSESARKLGAMKWASLTQTLNTSAKLTRELGVSFEGRQDAIAAFVDIAGKQGNLQNLTTRQMASGIEQLVASSDETAHILGMTRKEALEAAKNSAADANLTALIQTMNLNKNALDSALGLAGKQFGDAGQQMLKEFIANGAITTKRSAEIAAINPEMAKLLENIANQVKTGNAIDARTLGAQANAAADRMRADPRRNMLTRLAIGGSDSLSSGYQEAVQTFNQGGIFRANLDPNKKADPTAAPVLDKEMIDREAVAAVNSALDTLANSILTNYGVKIGEMTNSLINGIRSINDAINGLQKWPSIVSNVGLGLGALALTLGAIKMGRNGAALAGLGRGAAGAAGRGAAGAGAAGALGRGAPASATDIIRAQRGLPPAGAGGAGTGAGNTILSQLMKGGRGALGSAGGLLKAIPYKALGKNALVGGMFEGLDYLTGNKEMSWKNAAKSSLRIGGGAIGGLAGGIFGGGIASAATGVAGGMAGYKAGDLLADAIFGADDIKKPTNAAKTPAPEQVRKPQQQNPQSAAAQQATQRNNNAPANATPAQRGRNTMSVDQMTSRIMEHSDRSANHLKVIKDQAEKQTELMREEIAAIRSMNDRLGRLLEEGNKNTRRVADQTV